MLSSSTGSSDDPVKPPGTLTTKGTRVVRSHKENFDQRCFSPR